MSWKSTLILVLLAAGAGAWFFLGDEVAPRIGLNPANPEPTKSAAIAILDGLKAQDITAVKIAYPSGEAIEVSRADTHVPWKMPGNWPLREAQVRELVETLGNLRTRFHARPASGDDLTQYGLAAEQRPLRIVLTLKSGTGHTLTFGDPNPGEEYTAFTRPAFVRVDDIPEVLTLGPNVMPVLARSAESYRRRQLFMDVERVRLAGGNAAPTAFGAPPSDSPVVVTLPGEETETIAVRGDGPKFFSVDLAGSANFTLTRTGKLPEPGVVPRGGEPALPVDRLADVWRMAAPHSEPAEPAKLRGVLAAVADMWVDHFVTVDPIPLLREFPAALESPLARAARLAAARKEEPSPDKRMGFTDSRRAITVKTRANEGLTVEFGGIARIGEREEPMTIPGGPPGAPPQTTMRKVPTEFRYARVAGNPQVFIVPAEKFSDLFVSAADLADPRVTRFEPDEVQEITLQRQGGTGIKLFRKKGNASARKDEEKQDRWFIDATPNPLLAESSRVIDLLDKLSAMRTEKEDRREYPPPHRLHS
ncbi:MAG TPA: DUF4340 domain-containing protein [Gemmata sp.]|nr:DUF4340 domain-containing protein [Gemmata sp.]